MTAADTAWMKSARCAGLDTNIFFPPADDRRRMHVFVAQAKRVCSECPVRQPCLEYAISNNELGVWGGTSREERATLTDRRRGVA